MITNSIQNLNNLNLNKTATATKEANEALIRKHNEKLAEEKKDAEKLSSGKRINRSGDDPAGMAISESLLAQLNGATQAARNTMDGSSLIGVADGALNETSDMLNRMEELAIQAGNGTYSDSDRAIIQNEMDELQKGIDDIGKNTEFNGKNLLDGSQADDGLSFQTGANAGENLVVKIGDMTSNGLGLNGIDAVNGKTDDILDTIAKARETVSSQRGSLGAYQNRLNHTYNNLGSAAQNEAASLSKIKDADIAKIASKHKGIQTEIKAQEKLMFNKKTQKNISKYL